MSQKQFVIIGNSAAGIAAAEAIRQRDKASKILVFSDEDYSAYCRCLISYYLAGDIKEDKIRIEYHYKGNGGKHTAMRLAYQLAKTKYLLAIDSDD